MTDVDEKRMTAEERCGERVMRIPAPTPIDIEEVLVGMMNGTGMFARFVKLMRLDEAPEARRLSDRMWWAWVIGPDNVSKDCNGGGTTQAEAAAAAWLHLCLGAWWIEEMTDDEVLNGPLRFRNLSEEEYRSAPRSVPEGYRFELCAVPTHLPGGARIQ